MVSRVKAHAAMVSRVEAHAAMVARVKAQTLSLWRLARVGLIMRIRVSMHRSGSHVGIIRRKGGEGRDAGEGVGMIHVASGGMVWVGFYAFCGYCGFCCFFAVGGGLECSDDRAGRVLVAVRYVAVSCFTWPCGSTKIVLYSYVYLCLFMFIYVHQA